MNIQDAIDVIESVSGFTDESTPVGEAWAEVLSFIHRPAAQPEPVAPTDAASTQHPITPPPQLVERVATAMQPGTFYWSAYELKALAAILEVAAWLRSEINEWYAADRLEQEANR